MTDNAATDRYGLVGYPVHHSRSPLIHQLFARQTSQRLTYELIEAQPADFETAVRGFGAAGGKGLNVTVPHKEAAYRLAAELGEEAAAAGAVNTLSFRADGLRGDNTDGVGFLRDLTVNHGCAVADRRVLILGAGGAVRGILPPLLSSGLAELVVANRTLERAEQLRDRFAKLGEIVVCRFGDLEQSEAFDLVVNATSAGLHGETPPFPSAIVGPESFCYDLAYSRNDTPFVAWARAQGAGRAEQGLGMLVEQAAESFRIWRGVRPETRAILAQLVGGGRR
ncbi:MAG TPA: shikimate dehydrogenase [Gammaproteobacteria bacterium]|nr:shikimate dehydrogenase [Gammaproteobacteria bacterium]